MLLADDNAEPDIEAKAAAPRALIALIVLLDDELTDINLLNIISTKCVAGARKQM
jgi:hypothetical protein